MALPIAGIAAESPEAAEPYVPVETNVELQDSTELRIYRQRLEVTAEVCCRIVKKGPSFCTANVGSAILDAIEPEMILKYANLRLGEQEFSADASVEGRLKFRTDRIDYSGPQVFDVDIIYLH